MLAVWREWVSQHKNEIFASRSTGFAVADGKTLLADTTPAPVINHDAINTEDASTDAADTLTDTKKDR